MTISLPVRFWCAVPSGRPAGLVEERWDLDPARTAFVSLHCWNIGTPGGPPVPADFWVFMGDPHNHEVMWQIVQGQIAPAMAAARRVGMPVVHVQSEAIANRYPQRQPPVPPAGPGMPGPGPISDHQARRASRVHGEGYMQWPGWADADIAEPVRPQRDEVVVHDTRQFDVWLRGRGIDTLLYTGFCTNLCILDSPAAMKAMCGLGYRCVILREGTTAVEFPDTWADLTHTRAAIRYIESWVGYSAGLREFVEACGR